MASLVDLGGRLLLLGLSLLFLYQVVISANKLREEKTAVSTTKQYDQSRLMPTIAVCFEYEKYKDYQGNNAKDLANLTLNQSRQVKL